MTRVTIVLIKTLNRLLWAAYYFVLPPNENDREAMRLYNQRATW
ncbi:MAG: hypothetical protein FD138_3351 [Planctomycetota bacterium]|nr:MAG: hypothetical protein FD138_3351 [Planctomycetota bacterium]